MTQAGLEDPAALWLALVVGNTRLHWMAVQGDSPLAQWHTRHLTEVDRDRLIATAFSPAQWTALLAGPESPPAFPLGHPPIYGVTVVPDQGHLWQVYPGWRPLTLGDIPLGQTYDTLGCDRALNLWAAGERYGWPVLVIDGGTALTLTAGVGRNLLGGAILPGIRLWGQALGQGTAQLPLGSVVDALPLALEQRWSRDTPGAIASGLAHALRATLGDYLQAWRRTEPQGRVVVTGGDGPVLFRLLSDLRDPTWPHLAPISPDQTQTLFHCPQLSLDGLRGLVGRLQGRPLGLSVQSEKP